MVRIARSKDVLIRHALEIEFDVAGKEASRINFYLSNRAVSSALKPIRIILNGGSWQIDDCCESCGVRLGPRQSEHSELQRWRLHARVRKQNWERQNTVNGQFANTTWNLDGF